MEVALETAINVEMSSLVENSARSDTSKKYGDDKAHSGCVGDVVGITSELISDQARLEFLKRSTAEKKLEESENEVSKSAKDQSQQIPLLNLVKKLLKTSTATTIAQLNNNSSNSSSNGLPADSFSGVTSKNNNSFMLSNNRINISGSYASSTESITQKYATVTERSPSLSLLLRFQRLLICRIVSMQNQFKNGELLNGEFFIRICIEPIS